MFGYFDIDEILKEVTARLSQDRLAKFKNNAHVKRALVKDRHWDGFWIFRGSRNSRRFNVAVPFTREIAEKVMLDREGRPWKWGRSKTDLQVIGSYTRSCRIIDDEGRMGKLWSYVGKIEKL